MARLRVYKANGGNIYDLVMYRKDKKEREIREEIQRQFDREIKKKRKQYTDAWESTTISTQTGKIDGLYYKFKSLRGICG